MYVFSPLSLSDLIKTTFDVPLLQDKPSKDIEAPISLLDAYHLREKADESYLTSLNRKYELSKETEVIYISYLLLNHMIRESVT